jgi:uncharacterized protein (DUF58 family)
LVIIAILLLLLLPVSSTLIIVLVVLLTIAIILFLLAIIIVIISTTLRMHEIRAVLLLYPPSRSALVERDSVEQKADATAVRVSDAVIYIIQGAH